MNEMNYQDSEEEQEIVAFGGVRIPRSCILRAFVLYMACGLVCFAIAAFVMPLLKLQGPGVLLPLIGAYYCCTEALLLITAGVTFNQMNSGSANISFLKKLLAFAIIIAMLYPCTMIFLYFIAAGQK